MTLVPLTFPAPTVTNSGPNTQQLSTSQPDPRDLLLRQVAKACGWRQQDLRRFLIDEHLIVPRGAPCGVTLWDFDPADAAYFRSVEYGVKHKTRVPSNAPSPDASPGLCLHHTLYVRPAGLDMIRARIARRMARPVTAGATTF